MGRKLFVVVTDARRVSAGEVAVVALSLVGDLIRSLYMHGGEDGKPVPLRFDEQGRLVNPVSGVWLFSSPVHRSGLQLHWFMSLGMWLVPAPGLPELARAVSAAHGWAAYLEYISTCSAGQADVYESGRRRKTWGGSGESNTHRVSAFLRRYFLMDFRALDRWMDRWGGVHTYADLYAPHRRTRMDETLLRMVGSTEAELVRAYRAGKLPPDHPCYRFIRYSSKRWAEYDANAYPSHLFELASGCPLLGSEGVVHAAPRLVPPAEWFALQDAYEEALRKVERAAHQGQGGA